MSNKTKTILKNTSAALLAILVWQAASLLLKGNILIASPIDVLKVLPDMITDKGFYSSVIYSLSRITGGFLAGVICGCLLAAFSARSKWFEIILSPYMSMVKSVPVASFVIIALIWLTSSSLSVFISFLIVLPVIYTNVKKGIQSTDEKLLQMADAFEMPFRKRLIYIYLPQIKPYLLSSCSSAAGLAWKSGVAAEIIGIPDGSMGEALYYSKVYLDMPRLFAITIFIVLLSIAFEKLFIAILKLIFKEVSKL